MRIYVFRFKVVGKLNFTIENRKANRLDKVLGVLAGDHATTEFVRRWAEDADRLLAADGGADLLLRASMSPEVAVGDFDSITSEAKQAAGALRHGPDQSLSDCDKLLRYALDSGFSRITLIGAEGSRVDHMLGIIQSAARVGRNLSVRIAYESQLAEVLVGPRSGVWSFEGVFSLLPLSSCEGVSITGAEWDLVDTSMDALGLTSLSNQSLGTLEISIGAGAVVLFFGYDGRPMWSVD